MKDKIHLIVKGIGWAQSVGTNWCYRYYDVTIITNDLDLLKLQGIYTDTFGSLTNYFYDIRQLKHVDFISDDHLSEVKQSIRRMNKQNVANDFKALYEALKASK